MHRVLERQLRRLGLSPDEPPRDPDDWGKFLEKVESFYRDADQNRYLTERSMRLSSAEMDSLYNEVRSLSAYRVSRSEEHYRNLFDQTPIPTWEEDFSEVAEWLQKLRSSGVSDLESYLDSNPDDFEEVVSLIDVTNVNPAAIELVGASDKTQMLGTLDTRLVNEESKPSFVAQLMAIWDRSAEVKFHLVGSRLDGEKFHGILQCHVPVIDEKPDYSRVMVTIFDITEQTESERQMKKAMKSKDEFLASISHELRTPLTSVLGFAQILRSSAEASDAEERDSLLGIIADQAADLSDIVEDLLVAARSELGQLTVVAVPIDVHAQIAQVFESRSSHENTITVPERPKTKVMAKGDPQRVRQILRNLMTNAARYGGPEVQILVDAGSDFVRVSVRDNGQGLVGESPARVFERYYRDHDSGSQPGSVGIGLTISRELARMMGGDLTYRRIDEWTSFELTLQVNSDQKSHSAKNPSISAVKRSA